MKKVEEYVIENAFLQVRISAIGAEMQSIRGKDGTEYLWQGSEETWPDRAINLFPYIGRLTDGTYKYRGEEYQMRIHGFVPYSVLEVKKQEKDCICFSLSANEETRAEYPFEFCYQIEYALVDSSIQITFKVENQDDKTIHFGVGGHPGFQVPIGGTGRFEDYCLKFDEPADVRRVECSETCFVTGEKTKVVLDDGVVLPLRHDLFDKDAIILDNMSKSVTLRSAVTDKQIRVEYPQMDYLGIWHWPKTEVDYVCIEPWTSLPSRDKIVEDIETQENLIHLEAGKTYENKWSITIGQ